MWKRSLLVALLSLSAVGHAEENTGDENQLITRGEAARGGAVGGARYGGPEGRSRGTFDENGRRYGQETPYGDGRGAAYERGLNQGMNEGEAANAGAYIEPYPYGGENWNYGYPPPPPQNPSSEQYYVPPQQNYGYPNTPQ